MILAEGNKVKETEPKVSTRRISLKNHVSEDNLDQRCRIQRIRLDDLSERERALVMHAKNAVSKAVATQSGIRVGAAVETENGIYEGCNVESVISGLGICAERNAINHAVVHQGKVSVLKVAVAWEKDSSIRPCGACLQYIYEFSTGVVSSTNPKIMMLTTDSDWVEVSTLRVLLPEAYYT